MGRRTYGFTLIEVMLVIAIVGILAAIAIPNFIKFQAKGKQAEASANLKALYAAQKAHFALHSGYWSEVGALGFQPERGNRYFYDLGATAATVALGMNANCALANFQMRDTADITLMGGDCGVSVDSVRHGPTFSDAAIDALVATGMVMFVMENLNANLAADVTGVTGAQCPNCDFAARAKANIDNDAAPDEWYVSSQTVETSGVPGCAAAMTVATGTAFTSGSPAPSNDDVCN